MIARSVSFKLAEPQTTNLTYLFKHCSFLSSQTIERLIFARFIVLGTRNWVIGMLSRSLRFDQMSKVMSLSSIKLEWGSKDRRIQPLTSQRQLRPGSAVRTTRRRNMICHLVALT